MISWEPKAKDLFDQLIAEVPVFMRTIAHDKVLQQITHIAKTSRGEVTVKDVVDAFFIATPFGFHGPLKSDMQKLGVDYTKYGYQY